MEDLVSSVSKFNEEIKTFDMSVFNGNYVTGDIDESYFRELEKMRCDSAKSRKVPTSQEVVGLYNDSARLSK
jgi:amidophosphoribosyltransferase